MIFHELGEMCWRVKVCYDRFSGSKIKLRNGWNMIKPSIWPLREVYQNIPRQASDPSKQDRQFQRPAGSPKMSEPCMTSTAYGWNCSMHFNIHICHSERKWKHSGHDSILFQHILCKSLQNTAIKPHLAEMFRLRCAARNLAFCFLSHQNQCPPTAFVAGIGCCFHGLWPRTVQTVFSTNTFVTCRRNTDSEWQYII